MALKVLKRNFVSKGLVIGNIPGEKKKINAELDGLRKNLAIQNLARNTLILKRDKLLNEYDNKASSISEVDRERKKILKTKGTVDFNYCDKLDKIAKKIDEQNKKLNKIDNKVNSIKYRISDLESRIKIFNYDYELVTIGNIEIKCKDLAIFASIKMPYNLIRIQETTPQLIDTKYINQKDHLGERKIFSQNMSKYDYYIYKNNLYRFNSHDIYTSEEKELLIKENYYKYQNKFSKLQKEISLLEKLENGAIGRNREPIPEGTRFAVWRRDGSKCVRCGSKKNLEFDHIIPFSKGGSSSERNLQLLCQKCNREKSNKI
jgi:hypothetical protein